MTNITLTIHTATESTESIRFNARDAQPVRVQAQHNVNYELIDEATGFAPEPIDIKRVGNDLHVKFEDSGASDSESDLVIEGCYDEEGTNLLIGLHENGNIYTYVPVSGEVEHAFSQLAEEIIAPHVLGGEALKAAAWAFHPGWLLALVPVAVLIASGGSSGKSGTTIDINKPEEPSDTTALAAPKVVANDDGSVSITPASDEDTSSVVVNYIDENGESQSLVFEKDDSGNWVARDLSDDITIDPVTGAVTIPEKAVKDGSTVTATNSDDSGNVSEQGSAVAKDVTAPNAPVITISEADDSFVNADELADGIQTVVNLPEGTEAGDVVIVVIRGPEDHEESVDYTVKPEDVAKGSVAIVIPEDKVAGDGDYTVVAVVTDAAGNRSDESEVVEFEVDTTVATPSLELKNDTGVDTGDGITNDGTVVVDGLEADATWQYTTDGENWTDGEGTSFELGAGEYADGKVQVRQTDVAGNTSDAVNLGAVTVDKTAPTAPITIAQGDGDNPPPLSPVSPTRDITIEFSEVPYGENGELLTDQDIIALFAAQNNAVSIISLESVDGGLTWTGQIQRGADNYDGEETVELTGDYYDQAGNLGSGDSATVNIDTVAPTAAIDPVTGDNLINLVEQSSGFSITGTTDGAEVGDKVVVQLDGKFYEAEITEANGDWEISIPNYSEGNQLVSGNYDVQVSISDKYGNTTTLNPYPITVDLDRPTVKIEFANDFLNSTAEGRSSSFTITFTEPPYSDSQKTELTHTDLLGMLKITGIAPESIDIGGLTSNDGGVTWTGTITVKQGANVDDVNVSLSIDESSYYDLAGNPGVAGIHSITVDTNAPTVSINDIAEDNVINFSETQSELTISGTTTAEVGQEVTVIFNDKPYVVEIQTEGVWELQIPISDLSNLEDGVGFTVTANVNDKAGNPAEEASQEVSVDLNAPTIKIDNVAGDNDIVEWSEKTADDGFIISGTIEGAAEGDVIEVTFLDADGEPITITAALDVTNGTWSAVVSKGDAGKLNDGTVTVTVTDSSGNTASVDKAFTVAPPPTPVITGYYDRIYYVQGTDSESGGFNDSEVATITGQILDRFGGKLDGFELQTTSNQYGAFTLNSDGSWSYEVDLNKSVSFNDTSMTLFAALGESKSPLSEEFTVTDSSGKNYEIQLAIDERYAAEGMFSVTATTVAIAEDGPILIQSGFYDSRLEAGDGRLEGFDIAGDNSSISNFVIKINGNYQVDENQDPRNYEIGVTYEFQGIGAITVFADGNYTFEPYRDGTSLELEYTVNGSLHNSTIIGENTTYSNDLLGIIEGTVEGVSVGEVITLRLYVNKQSTDDSSGVQYQDANYPNGSDVTVTVGEGGIWTIESHQLRSVLEDIWWADHLHGDDEIYLQVKMVDPVTGKASEASTRYTFIADSYPPLATNVEYTEPSMEDGHIVTALVSNNFALDAANYANEGDEVTVTYDGIVVGTGVVGGLAEGHGDRYLAIEVEVFSGEYENLIPEGEIFFDLFKVHVTDTAGNTGTSDSEKITQLTVELPQVIIENYVDNVVDEADEEQLIGNGGFTNDNKGGLRGTIDLNDEAGAAVDEIWIYIRGRGPLKIEVTQEARQDAINSNNGILEWEIADTGTQFDQLTTNGTLGDGQVEIMAVAYNKASNSVGQSSSFNIIVDTVTPTVTEIKFDDDQLLLNETTEVTITFSEKPVGFDVSDDLTVVGGSVEGGSWDETGLIWTGTFIPETGFEGAGSIVVVEGSYTDAAGNKGAGAEVGISIDNQAPEVKISPEFEVAEDVQLEFHGTNMITISDNNLRYVELSVSEGVLNITLPEDVTIIAGVNGSSSMTLRGDEASLNAALKSLTYQGKAEHWSGKDRLTVKAIDSYEQSWTGEVEIHVTPVADASNLELITQEIVADPGVSESNGFAKTDYTLPLGTGGNGVEVHQLLEAFANATGNTVNGGVSTTAVNISTGLNANQGVKLSSWIYLESGVEYTFGGYADDSGAIVVGGQLIASGRWGASGTDAAGTSGASRFNGKFTPTADGYYLLDLYAHNRSGAGGYSFQIKKGNESAKELSTDNATVFQDITDILELGIDLGSVKNNGYFYQTYQTNEGEAGKAIKLSNIEAALTDTDGSETLALWIKDIPAGAVISDGVNSFTSTASVTQVDITEWNKESLTYTAPLGFSGTVPLKVEAISTERANNDTATTSENLDVTVHASAGESTTLGNFDVDNGGVLGTTSAWAVTGGTVSVSAVAIDGTRRLEIHDPYSSITLNPSAAVATSDAFFVAHADSVVSLKAWTRNVRSGDRVEVKLQRLHDNKWGDVEGVYYREFSNNTNLNDEEINMNAAEVGAYRLVITVDDRSWSGDMGLMVDDITLTSPSSVSGANMAFDTLAEPMMLSLEDDVDLELTIDSDRNSSDESSNWIDHLDNYVAGTSLLDTEDDAFVLIGDKVQHITDDGTSNISEYAGVEEIHLDGSVHFDLSYSDLLGSQDLEANSGPLKIFGGEDDVLDFGNNGSDALSNEEGRYADGDNEEAEDYGSWLLNGSVTEDGVTFDVYEYHSSASAGGDDDTKNQVLVQQGIEVI